MTKTYCDICGKEAEIRSVMQVSNEHVSRAALLNVKFSFDLCQECADRIFYRKDKESIADRFKE